MAEFQEVMRKWTRICNAVPGKAEHRNLCSNNESGYVCPLQENGLCNLAIAAQTNEVWAEGEHIIMSWAAEHPEPVYPTWGEWFVERGDLVEGWQNATNAAWMANTALSVFMKPISADIAQKLGIEPKEG